MRSDDPFTVALRGLVGRPGLNPDGEDVVRRAERIIRRRRIRAGIVGLVAGILALSIPVLLLGPFRSHPAIQQTTPTGTAASTGVPGTITASKDAVPEGRLVFQLNSGLEVLPSGATRSISLGAGEIAAYGVSPDGSEVIATTYVREPTGVTRNGELITVDTRTGKRRAVLVRAGAKEDLGPAAWSPNGSMVAYRLTVFSVDPAKEFPHGTPEQTVCLVQVATKAVNCFPDLGTVDAFAWSPDGAEIVVDEVGAKMPLRLLDLRTGGVSDFVSPDDPALVAALGGQAPATFVLAGWSSTGQYVSTDVGAPAVFDRHGRFVMLGHSSQEFSEVAEWSPAGDVLAYAIGRPPYAITDLYLLDPGNGQDRLLYTTGQGERAPIIEDIAWSPSGRWLAVTIAGRTAFTEQTVRIIDVAAEMPARTVQLGPQDIAGSLVGWGP